MYKIGSNPNNDKILDLLPITSCTTCLVEQKFNEHIDLFLYMQNVINFM